MVYDKNSKRDPSKEDYRYFVFETEHKETTLEGDPKSSIGSLIDFRFEDRVRKENL